MMFVRSPLMANSFNSANPNHIVVVPVQADAQYLAFQESNQYSVVSPRNNNNKPIVGGFPEFQQEERKDQCPLKIQVIDETALVGNGINRQEIDHKEKSKPRRRGGGGQGRKKKENINERKGKKGVSYSRKEMEDLRFQDLDYQKKKWVQVYCGLEPAVAEEYDGLINSVSNHQNRSFPSIDFAPKPRARKAAVDAVAAMGKEYQLNIFVH